VEVGRDVGALVVPCGEEVEELSGVEVGVEVGGGEELLEGLVGEAVEVGASAGEERGVDEAAEEGVGDRDGDVAVLLLPPRDLVGVESRLGSRLGAGGGGEVEGVAAGEGEGGGDARRRKEGMCGGRLSLAGAGWGPDELFTDALGVEIGGAGREGLVALEEAQEHPQGDGARGEVSGAGSADGLKKGVWVIDALLERCRAYILFAEGEEEEVAELLRRYARPIHDELSCFGEPGRVACGDAEACGLRREGAESFAEQLQAFRWRQGGLIPAVKEDEEGVFACAEGRADLSPSGAEAVGMVEIAEVQTSAEERRATLQLIQGAGLSHARLSEENQGSFLAERLFIKSPGRVLPGRSCGLGGEEACRGELG
jgi:hypothetical protein